MADVPDYKRIIYHPGPVARIIMNRPKWHNALSHPMYKEIENAFDRAARDPEVRVIILSGAGECFSAGHDAIGVGTSPEAAPVLADGLPPEEQMKRFPSEHELWREYWIEHNWYIDEMHTVKIVPHPKPTMAMVHGYAIYGGMGMACCMDLIFATEDALFLSAGGFGNERTGLNWRKAAELAYEHRFVTGREAYDLGIVNRVYPTFEVLERETLVYAERVASQTPQLLQEAKRRLINARGLAGTYYSSAGLNPGISGNGIPDGYAHDRRYEGRGMARTPRALAALKAKLDSEAKPVPQNVLDALARAAARDPQASWAKALDAEWRDPENRERARRQREAWNERVRREAEEQRRKEAGVAE